MAKTKKRIPLRTIAQAAKVSISTVSRVLNQSAQVNPELEQRIRDSAAKLGVPLLQKKARMLAFLLSNRPMLHPFHSHVMFGAQTCCAEHDYHMLFFPVQYPPHMPARQLPVTTLIERRGLVDGFIVAGVNSENLLELLTQARVPFAVLGNTVMGSWNEQDCSVVWVDDIGGASEITRYLLTLGHETVWYVGNCRLPWLARRYEGYCSVMESAGLTPRLGEFDSQDEREIGYLGTKSILDRGELVSAIFAGTDGIAIGVFEALRDWNLRVGTDVSVAGFNDMPEAAILHPAVTSVRVFPEQVGRNLAAAVLQQIRAGDGKPQHVTIPTRLIRRESCMSAPGIAVRG